MIYNEFYKIVRVVSTRKIIIIKIRFMSMEDIINFTYCLIQSSLLSSLTGFELKTGDWEGQSIIVNPF